MKKASSSILLFSLVLFLCGFLIQNANHLKKVSGPVTHKNLSIFFIHGADKFNIDNLITLQEAIEQKKIVVHETGDVGELQVENVSDNHIFIQSGDIVKGGKQDRVLQYDLVVKPKSGRIPLNSFCVEQQRWSRRGGEEVSQFSSSNNRVASKKLRLAAKQNQSQGEVWNEVTVSQEKLSKQAGVTVNAMESASSLQLSLENMEVKKLTKEYMDNISKKFIDDQDVIGYIFAINGEINSADVYANSALFKKMWPKLLEASSIEAVSEYNDSTKFAEISIEQVSEWLKEVEEGQASSKQLEGNVKLKIKDSEKNVLFETYTDNEKDQWIHKNMIKK